MLKTNNYIWHRTTKTADKMNNICNSVTVWLSLSPLDLCLPTHTKSPSTQAVTRQHDGHFNPVQSPLLSPSCLLALWILYGDMWSLVVVADELKRGALCDYCQHKSLKKLLTPRLASTKTQGQTDTQTQKDIGTDSHSHKGTRPVCPRCPTILLTPLPLLCSSSLTPSSLTLRSPLPLVTSPVSSPLPFS